jgi:hypothetical protein
MPYSQNMGALASKENVMQLGDQGRDDKQI